ncbi:hypothetical protein CTheo_5534 [Ceratobasidium theobromae]|uniref:Rieske domain-containing protein n=1 Tax=Ceratobasidium theobromae TaxID=1582974 RepID=A0A5N5QHD3_9AGAM|nr:hypothetical protein CTheo_5534 [Ceratobasidium theobromae]
MQFIRIGNVSSVASHTRYLLTLRSKTRPSDYHSLILFRLSPASSDAPNLYAMESTCPHLGADLSHADVELDPEIEEMTAAVVCPWHRYDFDLRTGESSTGLKACAYPVELRDRDVWLGTPGEGSWEVVEKRPVSEDFAESRHNVTPWTKIEVTNASNSINLGDQSLEDEGPEPRTLMEWACRVLNTPNPERKVALTRRAALAWRTGRITSTGQKKLDQPSPPAVPPRENLVTVEPGKVGKRGKAGSERSRIAILHALANIEQWAIDLAWDIIARFGSVKVAGEPLPPQFFADWVKVAEDEANAFGDVYTDAQIDNILNLLGTYYGSQAVHAGLWDSATRTAHSLCARLCIIHLVHEARGLDVNPVTINKFRAAGDSDSVKVLEVIHWDEVTHVTAGHRWFTWACGLLGEDPVQTFRREVRAHFSGALKGPFNTADRARAGMSPEFYEDLKGEASDTKDKDEHKNPKSNNLSPLEEATTKPGQNVDADGSVQIGYQ